MWYEEPLYDEKVVEYAEIHGLDVKKLDWHLEAHHGWERHNQGYAEAIPGAAACVIANECDGDPLDFYFEKD